jgi:glyceraldehyde 3-phosphate dehydrogenase
VARKYFNCIVVNLGRKVGTSLADIAHYTERDSTYGRLSAYLYGYDRGSECVIEALDESTASMRINGTKVYFLREQRNPLNISWGEYDVSVVVDTTGKFLDPTRSANSDKGSIRGHLVAGAQKVVVSAPFKIKDKGRPIPDDAVTTVMGINESDFDPRRHRVISNASCTTNCLAHMIKPLLNTFGAKRILSASMATVHAATGSQQVLDRLPGVGKTDLRKNRSILNNIILTSTGAAKALALVIPEMNRIGFIAESVRIPTTTGSLIILVLSLQEEISGEPINRMIINDIYRKAAEMDPNGYLHYSDHQSVSGDIIGMPRAAAIIEGKETHTRTAELSIDLRNVPGFPEAVLNSLPQDTIYTPVTQAVVYGWYDNELGSYVNMLTDRTVSIAEQL